MIKQSENLPTLSIDATTNHSEQKLTYQWCSNSTNSNTTGTIIDGATNSSYTITKNDVAEIGQKYYYVKIGGNVNGANLESVNSNIATININLPEIIINKQPLDKTATPWTHILPTFLVTAEPIEGVAFTYQWYSNASNSTTGGTVIEGATNASYSVPRDKLVPGSTQHYYVQIGGNFHGLALKTINSNAVNLNIDSLPIISIQTQPVNKTAILGTTNLPAFSVLANNIDGVRLKYQWYSNTSDSTQGATKIPNATNLTYTTTQFDVGNVGSKYFFVQISGSIDGVELIVINSNVVNLNINALPTITISSLPQNLEVVTNQQIDRPTFFVDVNDIQGAQLKYQWYSNNNGNLIRGATGSSYTIPYSDVLRTGKKYYYVKINGFFDGRSLSPVVSNVSTLIINSVPRVTIISEPQNLVGILWQKENRPTFSVRVKEIKGARFEYQWYKNNNYIPGANLSSYTIPESDLEAITTNRYYVSISGFLYGASMTPINSYQARLTVNNPPRITIKKSPNNQNVIFGTTNLPTLSVVTNNIQNAQLNYQWYQSSDTSSSSIGWKKLLMLLVHHIQFQILN